MRIRRPGFAAIVLVACLVLPAVPPTATAQDAKGEAVDFESLEKDRRKKASLYPVAKRVSRYLGKAAEEVDAENPEEAKRLLMKLKPKRLNPYERALVYRLLAYVSYASNDQAGAIEWFVKVLGEEVLPLNDESRIRFNIAQLSAAQQKWADVVTWVDEWLRYVQEPDPLGYYLKGIAEYQLEQYDRAIASAEKAIDASPEPKEAWLRLLAALYAQKEDYVNVTPVLEELLLRYPKKQYWIQLSLIYGAREKYRHALSVQQVAYTQGFLTSDAELLRFARSYLYNELPYPAARVLEKGLEDRTIEADSEALELLANSWIAAREYDRSLPPLKRAAGLSKDGKLYLRLGQVHMQREQWNEAAAMLQKAVEKGVEKPGNADLLLGISNYNAARPEKARSHFVRARQHEESRAEADRWITHLESESGSQAS